MLIGISGKKGSGKDLVGKIIQTTTWNYLHISDFSSIEDLDKYILNNIEKSPTYYFSIKKFADSLKDIVCILTGCAIEDLENQEYKETPLGNEWNVYETHFENNGIDSKLFSNKLDMIAFNNKNVCYKNDSYIYTPRMLLQKIGTDLLRNQLHPNIWVNSLFRNYTDYNNWVITDVRFENEAQSILDRLGILIRVERDGIETCNHISETALDDYENFNYTINNNGTIEDLFYKVKSILLEQKIIYDRI